MQHAKWTSSILRWRSAITFKDNIFKSRMLVSHLLISCMREQVNQEIFFRKKIKIVLSNGSVAKSLCKHWGLI